MDIDEKAPVQASAGADVMAEPLAVWMLLTDLRQWPSWNPDVSDVVVGGSLTPGTEFRWKAGGATITSRLQVITAAPIELAWTGKTMGISAVHVWRLEERGGGTRVTTEESWAGLLPRLMPSRFTRVLQRSLNRGLSHLEAELDRRAVAALFASRAAAAAAEAPEAQAGVAIEDREEPASAA